MNLNRALFPAMKQTNFLLKCFRQLNKIVDNPFERYIQAGIESEFVTQYNQRINIKEWTLENHFEMVKEMQKNFDKLKERL